jgi:hypothetical protein
MKTPITALDELILDYEKKVIGIIKQYKSNNLDLAKYKEEEQINIKKIVELYNQNKFYFLDDKINN